MHISASACCVVSQITRAQAVHHLAPTSTCPQITRHAPLGTHGVHCNDEGLVKLLIAASVVLVLQTWYRRTSVCWSRMQSICPYI
eukprot:2117024-Amphidinium_carterae.1